MNSIETLLPDVAIPKHVLSIEFVTQRNYEIKELIGKKIDTYNIEILGDYLEELSRTYSDVVDLVASSKYYKALVNKHAYEELVKMIKDGELSTEYNGLVSSSAVKNYVENKYPDFIYLVEETNTIDRGLSKRIASVTSLYSKQKEVLKYELFAGKNSV